MEQETIRCCANCKYTKECENYNEERKEWLCLSWKHGKPYNKQLSLFGESEISDNGN